MISFIHHRPNTSTLKSVIWIKRRIIAEETIVSSCKSSVTGLRQSRTLSISIESTIGLRKISYTNISAIFTQSWIHVNIIIHMPSVGIHIFCIISVHLLSKLWIISCIWFSLCRISKITRPHHPWQAAKIIDWMIWSLSFWNIWLFNLGWGNLLKLVWRLSHKHWGRAIINWTTCPSHKGM